MNARRQYSAQSLSQASASSEPTAIKCPTCGVSAYTAALLDPKRCVDPNCGLRPKTDADRDAIIQNLQNRLQLIRGHMHACIIQRSFSDDKIIFDHIEATYKIAGGAE